MTPPTESAITHPDAQFSTEFSKVHGANWTAWLAHLKGKSVQGLELGTWLGESAEWALANIFTHPSARYHCVDTFAGSEEHHLAGIDCSVTEGETRKRLAPFGHRAQIFRSTTDNAMKWMFRGHRFDLVYVDAAHDAMNVLRDAVLAFDLLHVGGLMIFDDYPWAVMAQEVDRPKLAVDSFMACYARRFEVVSYGGWQVAIRKIQ